MQTRGLRPFWVIWGRVPSDPFWLGHMPSRGFTNAPPVAHTVRMDTSRATATHTASERPVVGRFAPTPSGRMHLGNIFAALVAWLSVRSAGGRVILRIEDLDPRTQSGPWADLLLSDLHWLGLDWDEGPYYQRDRIDRYQAALNALKEAAEVYPCFCTRAELHAASAPHASDGTPIYAGTCRGLSPAEVAERSRRRPRRNGLPCPRRTTRPGSSRLSIAFMGRSAKCSRANAETFWCSAATGSLPTSLPWWWTTPKWA